MADYDVIIIGSGVAGALCAAGLAGEGRKVLVLEAAENGIGTYQRLRHHRVWDVSTRKSWNTPYLENPGIRYYPSPSERNDYYDQPDVGSEFKAYYQRVVGGSTWAWRGNTPRMMPNDFRLRSVYFAGGELPDGANVADWPLSYDELKPWYLKAEYELGVSGNAEEWESLTPRDGAKYPMPAQPKSYSDKVLITHMMRTGANKVVLDGQELRAEVISMAQARNSEPYDGRPACEGNHTCIPLCPTHAKYDATIHLRRALKAGVEIRTACVVTRLEAAPNGVIRNVYYKHWDSEAPKAERTVSGHVVILAANPIETPKILLMSGLYHKTDPHVGKNLMDHVQGECLGKAGEDSPIFPFRGPQTLCGIDSLRDGRYRRKFASFRITLGNDGWGRDGSPTSVLEEHLNPKASQDFVIGKELRKQTVEKLTRLVRLGFSTEQLPHTENRVELSDKLDDLDVPRPRIHYKVHDYTRKALHHGFRVSKQLLESMGAEVEETEFLFKNWRTAAHPMGTCRMGTDRTNSVVDKFGRCHNHPNLFIVGASVFPTGSATNPVLTLSALTLLALTEIKRAV